MARVGISRTPMKMGTGALNFMAGVAQVQQMTQAQEAHEQNLQKNDQAMRLADAHEERLQRQDARQEQEASRNQIAFDSQLTLGRQRARTWNGRDKPAWASSGLNQRYSDLNDLSKRIKQGRQRGDDMSADVLAFSQLANEYDTLYKQESTQRNLTNNISELEGLYEMTGLQPDPEVAGFIESVQSNVGGVGYTSMEATPEQQRALATELGRARSFAQEYEVRQGIKSDIDSMREMLNMMRAGRLPEGFTIDQSVVEEIAKLRVGGESDEDDMSATTLSELVTLLDPSAKAALNPWDPEQDVSKLQDQVRQATGLFEILATKEGKNQHDLLLNVRSRMEKERRQFSQRNQVAQMVQTMRQQQPDGPMSPIERWASRHMENAGSGRFDLTYDDDPEYVRMWKAISEKAELLGGDTQMAIVAMNQAWREAAPVREKWRGIQKRPTMSNPGKDYDAEYYGAYVDDILASQQQLEQNYTSKSKLVDNVVNLDIRKTEDTPHAVEGGVHTFEVPFADFVERSRNSADKTTYGLTDKDIRMISDRLPEGSAGHYGAGDDVQALSIALKQAGVPRALYYGFQPETPEQGFDIGAFLAQSAVVPIEALRTGSHDAAAEMIFPRTVKWSPTRTTFAEFAQSNPKLAAKVLFALENPDPAWVEAERNIGGLVDEGWAAKTAKGAVKPGSISAQKEAAVQLQRTKGIVDAAIGLGDVVRKRNMDAMRPALDEVADTLPAERREALVDGPMGQAQLESQMEQNMSGGRGREDMMFPEAPERTDMLQDVPQDPQSETLGIDPTGRSQKVPKRGAIPDDPMLTAASGPLQGELPDDPALPPMPRRSEAFELADLGGDYPVERADPQSVYESSSRTKVRRVSEDPIYATADKHAKTKRLPEVEQMLERLMERRRKSGDGKLTRKDAAMLAALIERRNKLLGAKQRRR